MSASEAQPPPPSGSERNSIPSLVKKNLTPNSPDPPPVLNGWSLI